MVYDKARNYSKFNPLTRKTWRAVEKRVRSGVVVEVNELPLPVPKYSCAISAARTDSNGQVIDVNPNLPMYAIPAAIELLQEVYAKYTDLRATKQEEFDARRAERTNDYNEDSEDDIFRDAQVPVLARRNVR